MACFTVPLAGAVAAGVAHKTLGKGKTNPFVARLPWLVKMSLGGSFLLAIEHIYHGEIIFTPPFLTAAKEGPEAVSEMLHEMATVGVSMAVLLLVVWVGMVLVSEAVTKRTKEFSHV
ncbi:MAG: hypothetical protein IJH50_00185 [Kiritimatiellae bacterium]|nr:hypothetical protein [Kiritimatiellia bacterium]